MTTERIRELGKIERTGKVGGVEMLLKTTAFFYFAPAKGLPTCQSSREGKRHYSFHKTSESFGGYRRSCELHCSMALREGRGTALYELQR